MLCFQSDGKIIAVTKFLHTMRRARAGIIKSIPTANKDHHHRGAGVVERWRESDGPEETGRKGDNFGIDFLWCYHQDAVR